jgi:ketosteroid isomerase-like protein
MHMCCHGLSALRCTYVGGQEVVGIDTGIRCATCDRSDVRTGLLESLPSVVADYIAAVNDFDEDGIVAIFADDAVVNDARREFWGADEIRKWVIKEFLDDHVTMDVTEVIGHHAMTVVRARYDGEYDKTKLPEELVLTNYHIEDGRIVRLMIIHNETTSAA